MSFNTVTISLDEYNELIKRNKVLEKVVEDGTECLVGYHLESFVENWNGTGILRRYNYICHEDIKGKIVEGLEYEYKLRLRAKDDQIKELEQELSNHKIKKIKKPFWRFW